MMTSLLSSPTSAAGVPRQAVPFGGNSMQHGTAVFEGIRCYAGPGGAAVFRLDDHLHRLLRSAEAIGMPHALTLDGLREQVLAAARVAGGDCYLRPAIFAPDPILGLDLRRLRFECLVEVWPAGGVLAQDSVRVTVSPWCRPSGQTFPRGVKATGMYVMSALARTQAAAAGFDDAIQLDPQSGNVAEATVANVFLVRAGRLITPWSQESLLPGITRATILALAADLGIDAVEAPVAVAELLEADEVFLTGTAIGLVRVEGIDGRTFPPERPVFHTLLERFRATVTGGSVRHPDWLTALAPEPQSQSRSIEEEL
jgi:branched-chain amino acid aminotransferase